jgi:predicted Zn-dependent protease
MRILRILLLCMIQIITFQNNSNAISIIRDDETESVIKELVKPILKVANIYSVSPNIFILNSPDINAFTIGGETIFINTGLITFSDTPETLIGVLAHEIGHIAGGHVISRKEELRQLNKELLLSFFVGFLAATVSKSTEMGIGTLHALTDANMRMFLKFNRIQESEADNAALKYLSKLNVSNNGLLKLLQFFSKDQKFFNSQLEPYLSTHPFSNERINFLKSYNEKNTSNMTSSKFLTQNLRQRFARVVAKIKAWSNEDLLEILKEYDKSDATSLYARSICYFRQSNFTEAIANLNKAIKLEPTNAYFHEQLAQFYFETGKSNQAIQEFSYAHQILPRSIGIAIGYAHALLSMKENSNKSIDLLEFVVGEEHDNVIAWKLLGMAYSQKNDIINSNLAFALEAILREDVSTAKKLINAVEKVQNLNNKTLLKIKDIKVKLLTIEENKDQEE